MSRQKREEMIARVAEWQRSSMPMETFAQALGISKSTFQYWVRKLRDKAKPVDAFPGFIEMRQSVPTNQFPKDKAPSEILTNPQIVLTFPSGLCLKIYG